MKGAFHCVVLASQIVRHGKFFSEINKYIISILMFLAGLGFLTKYLSGDELRANPWPCCTPRWR